MVQVLQKGDLNSASFSNNNSANAGGVGVRVDAGSTVGAAISAAITAAVAGLPVDKHVNGLQSYDAVTNTLTLSLSDGTTAVVPMAALVADAVAESVAASATSITTGKVAVTNNAGVTIGYLLPV